jgi:IMP dehydrogenase
MVPYKGSVLTIIFQLMPAASARHGLLRLPHDRGDAHARRVRRDHLAGIRESHVHDVQITKEAPNYRVE